MVEDDDPPPLDVFWDNPLNKLIPGIWIVGNQKFGKGMTNFGNCKKSRLKLKVGKLN